MTHAGGEQILEDPYRFASLLGDLDRHLMAEGAHQRLYDALGARPTQNAGVDGVQFAVWAPNASRVSVVGLVVLSKGDTLLTIDDPRSDRVFPLRPPQIEALTGAGTGATS